ncbi:MAG: hypothetical protein AB7P21_29110 [Lautropia sp.]
MLKMEAAEATMTAERSRTPDQPLPPMTLEVASERHTEAIDRLRQVTYASAGYFSLPDPETVRRRTDPPSSLCLVIMQGNTLAATGRFTPAETRADAERILEGEANLPAHCFPTLAMCRGATDPQFRGLGLMAFIVSAGVAAASRAGLGSAVVVQYDGTPHARAMKRAGWESRPIGGDRMGTVRGHADLSLLYIPKSSFKDSEAHSATVHARLRAHLKAAPFIEELGRLLEKRRR